LIAISCGLSQTYSSDNPMAYRQFVLGVIALISLDDAARLNVRVKDGQEAIGPCPSWVGHSSGHCVTDDADIHAGACHDPNDKGATVQCLPPDAFSGYQCASATPVKCSYPASTVQENISGSGSGSDSGSGDTDTELDSDLNEEPDATDSHVAADSLSAQVPGESDHEQETKVTEQETKVTEETRKNETVKLDFGFGRCENKDGKDLWRGELAVYVVKYPSTQLSCRDCWRYGTVTVMRGGRAAAMSMGGVLYGTIHGDEVMEKMKQAGEGLESEALMDMVEGLIQENVCKGFDDTTATLDIKKNN